MGGGIDFRYDGEGVGIGEDAEGLVIVVDAAFVVPFGVEFRFRYRFQELWGNRESRLEKPRVLLRQSYSNLGSRFLVFSS